MAATSVCVPWVPVRRPADAGEFARAVRRVREGIGEPSGLTGVMGVGVQGLAEAPWLNLDTPAATNGWWAHGTGSMPAASPSVVQGHDGGGSRTIVVHREERGRYAGGGEPFLQRWLFSPRLAVVALIVALGVGLGLGGWWLTSGRYASIPVVTNDSVTQATDVLTAHGFKIAKDSPVHSNGIAKGSVVGTTPSGRVAKGTAGTILVSSGPFTSVVPRVSGDKLPAAQAALQRAHLTYSVDRVGSDAAAGTVLGTKPAAGTSWPQTKPVTIQVSGGAAVPNFVGQSQQVAQDWASAHGAHLQTQQDQNSQQPSGTITQQEPAAGSLYQPGETVVVTVSSGPAEVNVPDVIGMSVRDATQELQGAGFNVQVQSFGLPSNPDGKVWDYSPVGQAPRGSTILLDVLPGGGGQGGGGGGGF